MRWNYSGTAYLQNVPTLLGLEGQLDGRIWDLKNAINGAARWGHPVDNPNVASYADQVDRIHAELERRRDVAKGRYGR